MSRKMSRYPHDAKVYVGELGNNASKQEIEDAFAYYGPLRNVWVARNPPGFAFVEFEDARDAEDSVRGLDGRTICGRRARVELSTGKGGRGFRGGGSGGGGPPRGKGGRGNFHPDDRCYECGGRGHYARDCTKRGRSKGRKRSRSRSPRSRSRELRTRSKSYSRSRSRDRVRERDRDRRTRSKTPRKTTRDRSITRDHTKSPRRSKTHSRSRSRTPRSATRSRSRSHRRNGGD
ncbi:probable splicing factor, arginine/serine-rich 6 isoform X1 [Topomyia yanbarensis]|uniref:probable splicing factor, arginine/serine-rich 6 isoform X1 n=2 Tax=Topomyia yanbarensis TaxID=2498891 RepID=UPI00273C8FA6|nr:probable splicing factor, arginine/serine-rich 6 isoform X1 [Topomyia yanbarensis]